MNRAVTASRAASLPSAGIQGREWSGRVVTAGLMVFLMVVSLVFTRHAARETVDTAGAAATKPVLAVAAVVPRYVMLPTRIAATGNVMAWQEASIGAESDGLRLASVDVNVGDVVRRGQRLAAFAADMVIADLARSRAVVAEMEAALAEARDNAERAQGLQATGAMSAQQIQQYVTAERTARARLEAAQAAEKGQRLRLAQTQVIAPDGGVISARSATVGAVVPAGHELFRLLRGGRLEWRAEVAASDLARLKPGDRAVITPVGGGTVEGTLRMVAPVVDARTGNGLVYVDLPPDAPVRAGMFARGELDLGSRRVLSLPQSAVLLQDGFSHVMQIGEDSRVTRTKVTVGGRVGGRVEIIGGVPAAARVVAAGGAFVGDGDLVRVVEESSVERAIPGPASATAAIN